MKRTLQRFSSSCSRLINEYETIVIGGGHAGCEAASASARVGAKTLLLTQQYRTIGEMSCNPAFGGIGKGTLVREIDAMDGLMGRVADHAGIQYRVLNRRKGPAVHGLRAQADRDLYRSEMQRVLSSYENLEIRQGSVEDLYFTATGDLGGVTLQTGDILKSKTVVICTGTFLRGVLYFGKQVRYPGGRINEAPSNGLSKTFQRLNFELGRLTTATPPRLNGKTIDYKDLETQPSDDQPIPFSYYNQHVPNQDRLISCYATNTNETTHEIIRQNLNQLPEIFGSGRGPRYCPSLEAKIFRFPDRQEHRVWLEPEGLTSDLIYPNGLSTGFSEHVQLEILRSMKGLERVEMVRPGYAVEYDFVLPTNQLTRCLETKRLDNLYLAGQINGTTGYEEAGAQGIVAGANAGLRAVGSRQNLVLNRNDSFTGVMIDDLISKPVTEPYRVLTSRAEYRLMLRPDNADERVTPLAAEVGLISAQRSQLYNDRQILLKKARDVIGSLNRFATEWASKLKVKLSENGRKRSVSSLLSIQGITLEDVLRIEPDVRRVIDERISQTMEAEMKYSEILSTQTKELDGIRKQQQLELPFSYDYSQLEGFSREQVEKLNQYQPKSIGEASQIQGISAPALVRLCALARDWKTRTHQVTQ